MKKHAVRVIQITAFEVSIGFGRHDSVAIELQLTPSGQMTEFYIPTVSIAALLNEQGVVGVDRARSIERRVRFTLSGNVLAVLLMQDQEVLTEVIAEYIFDQHAVAVLRDALRACAT